MTKQDMSTLLHGLDIPVGEGEHFLDSREHMPKVAYWEYVWEDTMASGDDYEEVVTYQISFVAQRPRHAKLLELKKALNDIGIHPVFYHEYVASEKSPGYYHTYFNLDVEEELTNV